MCTSLLLLDLFTHTFSFNINTLRFYLFCCFKNQAVSSLKQFQSARNRINFTSSTSAVRIFVSIFFSLYILWISLRVDGPTDAEKRGKTFSSREMGSASVSDKIVVLFVGSMNRVQ